MKGIELCKAYFDEFGNPMLERFPELVPFLAVGICGSGSECFGFDDELSRDHDFEPGFCIFLPSESVFDRKAAFELERAYEKLPKEFMGVKRQRVKPVGGARHGVIRSTDFFVSKCGSPDAVLSDEQWLLTPEYALAEAVNGEIFFDNYGEFSEIRKRLMSYPDDVRKKKLAGNLLTMAQSGQYNYPRCVKRGETGASQLAVFEFVNAAMHTIFLINRRYMPYYKWSFRALRELDTLGNLADSLEFLISSDNEKFNSGLKMTVIEDIAGLIAAELEAEALTDGKTSELEPLAYAVNSRIEDLSLRNSDIFSGKA